MKILFVSDIHYGTRLFHGVDESKRFEWLYSVLKEVRPELLISAGDFGQEATQQHFQPILEITSILTTYGNHDNLKLLKGLRNLDGSKSWLEDGTIIQFSDTRIAGINGNVAVHKRKPHHKTIGEIEGLIQRYSEDGQIDILVTHEVPKHPSFVKGRNEMGYAVFNKALEMLKPRVCLTGHIHFDSSSLTIGKTLLVNIDSSLRHNQYAIISYAQREFRAEIVRHHYQTPAHLSHSLNRERTP